MGTKISGAVFQRFMDQVLGNLQPRRAVVYIDDIAIFSLFIKQYLKDLRDVFKRLQKTI